jgi:hypothetical protein
MTYMGDEAGHLSLHPPDTMFLSRDQARKLVSDHMSEGDIIKELDFKKKPQATDKNNRRPSASSGAFAFSEPDIGGGASINISSILSNRIASSPKSKASLMKETAIKNQMRKQKEQELAQMENPDPNDIWEIQEQAGCSFFVNRLTGELTLDDPFVTEPVNIVDLAVCKPRIDPEISKPLATGAVVYEEGRDEFVRVMDFLEGKRKGYE